MLHTTCYGGRKARMLRGTMIDKDFKLWAFCVSKFDQRFYFKRDNNDVIFLLLAVNDMPLASNKRKLLEDFKLHLQKRFNVRLYGKLTTFIDWCITHEREGTTIHQKIFFSPLSSLYLRRMLQFFYSPWFWFYVKVWYWKMRSGPLHCLHQAITGGISCLGVSTRTELTFPIYLLSRQRRGPTASLLEARLQDDCCDIPLLRNITEYVFLAALPLNYLPLLM